MVQSKRVLIADCYENRYMGAGVENVIYCWSQDMTVIKFVEHAPEVCAWFLLRNPIITGGPNCGGYYRQPKKVSVDDRSVATLLAVIVNSFRPGATIRFVACV